VSEYFAENYFANDMIDRQRLLRAVATRRQLERWEPYVASAVLGDFAGRSQDGGDVWSAAIEHHFALIAARNLVRALELPPATSVAIDETLRAELIEGRDLNEHWDENMPVFNVHPRSKEPPRQSGRKFAARNPCHGPYDWLSWSSKTGARLLPHVSAAALHKLLDDVEAEVLTKNPRFDRFMPPRPRSPWLHENGEWWPKPEDT